ncbi:NXPE family member 3-like [Haliotis cracherodii]|uniref:NXPE family member 3-like n=1 Tax=Haliotis cracherodii TaxID=6455 RepID=UPI0039ECDB7C
MADAPRYDPGRTNELNGWLDGWLAGWLNGWLDGWMISLIYFPNFRNRTIDSASGREQANRGSLKTGLLYLKEEILCSGSIHNSSTAADAKMSYIYPIHNTTYILGDLIHVRIDLFDGSGNRKLSGGDVLRVWMEGKKTSASVSGVASDHNNGSYSVAFRAVWSGKATIKAFLATKREEIVLLYKLYQKYSSLWSIHAVFKGKNITEKPRCFTRPNTRAQTHWCNLTQENDGFLWYCMKSKNNLTNCDMWVETFSATNIHYKLNNSTENTILSWSATNATPDIFRRTVPVVIKDSKFTSKLTSPPIACNRLAPHLTWQRKAPNGFFYNNKWSSLLCNDTLPRTVDAYRHCLKGRTLWLHGDSTSMQFHRRLRSILNLPSHAGGHTPVTDTDLKHNFSLSWHAHELPFYHGARHYPRSTNQAQHIMMDRLPNTTKDIVVLYMYVHFTLVHPDVFRRHVRRLVPSAKNLLARAPNVTIAVRGPHAYFRPRRGMLSYWGMIYADIWHQEFSSLWDKIIYLDFWDLTMAKPSKDFHPHMNTVKQLVHNMMSLLCFRT